MIKILVFIIVKIMTSDVKLSKFLKYKNFKKKILVVFKRGYYYILIYFLLIFYVFFTQLKIFKKSFLSYLFS